MAELPKAELGRTGLSVTALGFGAMELRGAPRGRPIRPEQAADGAQCRARRGHQLHRHVDRLRPERGADRHSSSPAGAASTSWPASAAAWSAHAAAPAGQRNPHDFTRENIVAGVEAEPGADEDRLPGRGAVPRLAVGGDAGADGVRSRRCATCSARARSASSACPPRCPTSSSTSTWACSTCSRSRIRPRSGSTRRSDARGGGRAPAS